MSDRLGALLAIGAMFFKVLPFAMGGVYLLEGHVTDIARHVCCYCCCCFARFSKKCRGTTTGKGGRQRRRGANGRPRPVSKAGEDVEKHLKSMKFRGYR